MRILAHQGSRYLLVRDGVEQVEWETEGRILDDVRGVLYGWQKANRILKFGPWRPYNGSQDILDSMLEGVEEQPAPDDPDAFRA